MAAINESGWFEIVEISLPQTDKSDKLLAGEGKIELANVRTGWLCLTHSASRIARCTVKRYRASSGRRASLWANREIAHTSSGWIGSFQQLE